MMQFESYLKQTYAAWMGKVIGIRLGAPIEGWTAQEIQATYGEIHDYIVDYGVFAADDDSNGPLFFARALNDFDALKLTTAQMGETFLNYIPDHHGFFWWGGTGISSEQTAYENLRKGINAPNSGSSLVNGEAIAEQIGGQIFSDCWGYVAPNNPKLAAELATKASSVTHDLNGIHGGVFVAVAVSLAYYVKNTADIIDIALTFIPVDSLYTKVVKDICYFHKLNHDWHHCLTYVQTNYGYDKYPGVCHIIPNTAIMILAMLYGENDFSKTMLILTNCGWDTDCTLGNVGSIMGAMVGLEGIEKKWLKPIEDIMIASSCIGSLNISTCSSNALDFCVSGYKLAKADLPLKYKTILNTEKSLYHFEVPESTQGFRTDSHRYGEINLLNSTDTSSHYDHSLKIVINNAYPDAISHIFQQTYYTAEDLYDARYEPSFSPQLYPGESIEMMICNPLNLDFEAALYVVDSEGVEIIMTYQKIGKEWEKIRFDLPVDPQSTLCRFGLKIHYLKRIMHAFFYLDWVTLDRKVSWKLDFTKEKVEDYGLTFGGEPCTSIAQCTLFNGDWNLSEDGVHAVGIPEAFLLSGHYYWKNYQVEMNFTVSELTKNISLAFYIRGFMRYYAVELNEKDEICLIEKTGDEKILYKAPLQWRDNSKILLIVNVNCGLIKVELNKMLAFTYHDESLVKKHGQVGIILKNQSSAVIDDLKLGSC